MINIVLLGYMGSGKSLIGKRMSKNLEMGFLDLDDYIESKEKKKIKNIFSDHGEIYFRKKETFYLNEVLETSKNTIISLGGGTPCFGNNMEIIKQHKTSKSIYLQTSLEVLIDRLYDERSKRPLIAHIDTREGVLDFIRKHLFERSFYYNQAQYRVNTDGKSVDQLVQEIISELGVSR